MTFDRRTHDLAHGRPALMRVHKCGQVWMKVRDEQGDVGTCHEGLMGLNPVVGVNPVMGAAQLSTVDAHAYRQPRPVTVCNWNCLSRELVCRRGCYRAVYTAEYLIDKAEQFTSKVKYHVLREVTWCDGCCRICL